MTAVCSVCGSVLRVPAAQVERTQLRCLNAGRGCKGTMVWADASETVGTRPTTKSRRKAPRNSSRSQTKGKVR